MLKTGGWHKEAAWFLENLGPKAANPRAKCDIQQDDPNSVGKTLPAHQRVLGSYVDPSTRCM